MIHLDIFQKKRYGDLPLNDHKILFWRVIIHFYRNRYSIKSFMEFSCFKEFSRLTHAIREWNEKLLA